jgi:hypothetical protein
MSTHLTDDQIARLDPEEYEKWFYGSRDFSRRLAGEVGRLEAVAHRVGLKVVPPGDSPDLTFNLLRADNDEEVISCGLLRLRGFLEEPEQIIQYHRDHSAKADHHGRVATALQTLLKNSMTPPITPVTAEVEG